MPYILLTLMKFHSSVILVWKLERIGSIPLKEIEETRKVRFGSIGRIRAYLYPSAIEDDILQEMGFQPGFDLEKIVDQPEFLVSFLDKDSKDHFCSAHKAVIPIARMRVLLDQDDVGDTVSFRCPDCAKCLNCKRSQRSNAVSLQEAREQVIIEQSVKI